MWKWLQNLFGSPEPITTELSEELDEEPLGSPYREMEVREHVPATPSVKEEPVLMIIMRAAAEEVAEEKAKAEQKCLTDIKLQSYFQKAMKYIFSKLDTDSYEFVLVHPNNVGITDEAFNIFAQIFVKACSQLGIKSQVDSTYVNVNKDSVRRFLKTIQTKTPKIDIDAKVRSMLGN